MAEPVNTETEGFIVRRTYYGHIESSPLVAVVLQRLIDIENNTVNGEKGWHALLSHPEPGNRRYTNLKSKLRRRGFTKERGWEFHIHLELGSDGHTYQSMRAKFTPPEDYEPMSPPKPVKPPVRAFEDQPALGVGETRDQRLAASNGGVQTGERVTLPPELVHPDTPRAPIRANATPNPTGADPLMGLVFDTPPDVGQTISKNAGEEVDEPRRNYQQDVTPQWG